MTLCGASACIFCHLLVKSVAGIHSPFVRPGGTRPDDSVLRLSSHVEMSRIVYEMICTMDAHPARNGKY